MTSVLTLLTAPAAAGLDMRHVESALAALAARGAACGAPDWLAPGIACELPFSGPTPAAAAAAVRSALAGEAIDVAAQIAAGRRKRLLLADMDSTIVTSETLDELADFAGVKDRVAAITALSMNGRVDFEAALRERVAMLAGLPESALEATFERVCLTAGARILVRTMRAGGALTLLVSGGFRWFTRRVAGLAGFDRDAANDLLIENGRLTGEIGEPVFGGRDKLLLLQRTAAELGHAPAAAAAIGDGANDIPMLLAAGLGVAFRAKPVVAAAAPFRLDHADLTGLLYLQGYRQSEFRAD